MLCSDCESYPCKCYEQIGTVMSEARALVCVILIMITLMWAFVQATKVNDARWTPTHTTQEDTQ